MVFFGMCCTQSGEEADVDLLALVSRPDADLVSPRTVLDAPDARTAAAGDRSSMEDARPVAAAPALFPQDVGREEEEDATAAKEPATREPPLEAELPQIESQEPSFRPVPEALQDVEHAGPPRDARADAPCQTPLPKLDRLDSPGKCALSPKKKPTFLPLNDRTPTGSRALTDASPGSKKSLGGKSSPSHSVNTDIGTLGLRTPTSVSRGLGSVEDHFRLYRPPLGEGSFAVVHKAKRLHRGGELKSSATFFAVKTISLAKIEDISVFEEELSIHRLLAHRNICRLWQEFREDTQVHLILEFLEGGELWSLLEKFRDAEQDLNRDLDAQTRLSPSQQASYIWQMLSGIAYCHANKICHRDIKPENYILEYQEAGAPLKLVDFGLACEFKRKQPMTEAVGTLPYVAPEMLSGSYSETCDVWSIGAVAFMCCTNYPIWLGDDAELERLLRARAAVVYERCRWEDLPEQQALIETMLGWEGAARPMAKALMRSSAWLRRHGKRKQGCCSLL